MNKIFIDTSFLFAAYNSKDALHLKAKKLKPVLKKYNTIVSNFILLEMYTLLSQRVSKETSVLFGESIIKDKVFAIIWIDRKTEEDVWEIFKTIKDKNFSYVDASILAVMRKEKIHHLLSFDESFEKLEKKFHFTLIR